MEHDGERLKKYYELRLRLSHYVVEGNADHDRLMTVAKSNKFTAVDLKSTDFLKMCDIFERKGLLGPDTLDIFKEIFPHKSNKEAYMDIVNTERDMCGYTQDRSVVDRQPDISGSGQFARGTSGYIPDSSDGNRQPGISIPEQFATGVVGIPFHKTSENVFYYEDAMPYFKADIGASIGLIKIGKDHGTCFRIGDKYIMTAYHVVEDHLSTLPQECQILFGNEIHPCKVKTASFVEQTYDVAILKVVDEGKLPPPLTLAKNDPTSHVDIFGYPGEQNLQVDMRCPICNDLEVEVKEALTYWKETYPKDKEKYKFDEGFEILKHRTALHSSKTFEKGASGGPITRLDNGRPVVTMMYQGGTPSFYYNHYRGTIHPMKYRIEFGISMKKVYDILGQKGQHSIRDKIFQ